MIDGILRSISSTKSWRTSNQQRQGSFINDTHVQCWKKTSVKRVVTLAPEFSNWKYLPNSIEKWVFVPTILEYELNMIWNRYVSQKRIHKTNNWNFGGILCMLAAENPPFTSKWLDFSRSISHRNGTKTNRLSWWPVPTYLQRTAPLRCVGASSTGLAGGGWEPKWRVRSMAIEEPWQVQDQTKNGLEVIKLPILGIKEYKSMAILRDFPFYHALLGLVSYNDPCLTVQTIHWVRGPLRATFFQDYEINLRFLLLLGGGPLATPKLYTWVLPVFHRGGSHTRVLHLSSRCGSCGATSTWPWWMWREEERSSERDHPHVSGGN